MTDNNRAHTRVEKPLTVQYCIIDGITKKWDMSVVKNISAGGVMFVAPTDLKLKDKIIRLRIKVPELAPHLLELEAVVVNVIPQLNKNQSNVGAKFINLSELSKKNISVVMGKIRG